MHRPRAALRYVLRALELFRAAGHKAGQANAISNAGWCRSVLGEHEEALACYQQALALHREIDNRDGECFTWDCLGNTYHRLGRHGQRFLMYKIRTMRHDAEAASGPVWTTQARDPRVTP